MNKSSLLNQLRIARDVEKSLLAGLDRRWLWGASGAIALVVVAALGWVFFFGSEGVAVHEAQARAISAASAAQGSSLLDASGYVVARRQATVSAKITGKVISVPVEEGDRVRAGQVIAQLDDSNARAALELAKANLVAAKLAYSDDEPIYQMNVRLKNSGAVSQQAFDTARTTIDQARANLEIAQGAVSVAQVNLDDTTVRAPFSGIVTDKAAQPGEMISPISAGSGFTRTGIATIVDMDSLEVDVDVAESFINRVRSGMPASVTLNAYPDWQIPANVIAVIPTADRSKATVTVRVGFKVKDARIVPEMGARVAFLDTGPKSGASASAGGVIVPADAIVDDAGTSVVFVVAGDTVERRAVKLGARHADGQVVLAGLAPGDLVAEDAASPLHDGDRVHVTTADNQAGD